MADSDCCSARSDGRPRLPLAGSEKGAARRNTFIRLLLDWPAPSGHRCSGPATSLVRIARLDAGGLPSGCGRRIVADRMGIDDDRLSLAPFALFPGPCG